MLKYSHCTTAGTKNGYYADLVLLNPDTVADRSSLGEPTARSSGITAVWINGRITYSEQKLSGERPGVFVNR